MRIHREGRLRLADGRWAEYREAGHRQAPVVLYCHGSPGSRQEIGWAEQVLARSGARVRLVSVNRPGYGGSTWAPLDGFRAWVPDALAALDMLGVDRFAVLGASGGAPFGLALAIERPHRVTRIGVAAGVAPPTVLGMDRSALWVTEPRSSRRRRVRYAALAAGYRLGLGALLEPRLLAALAEPDRLALADPDARSCLRRVVREAFAQGGRAAAHEAGLYLRPWDLDLARCSLPVHVWHGALDTRIPVEVSRGLAGLLPDASVTTWAQHGHFSWASSTAVVDVAAHLTGRKEEGPGEAGAS